MKVCPKFQSYVLESRQQKLEPQPKLPEKVQTESFGFQGNPADKTAVADAFWLKQQSTTHLDQVADQVNNEKMAGLPTDESDMALKDLSRVYAEDLAHEPGKKQMEALLDTASQRLGFRVAPGGGDGYFEQQDSFLQFPLHREATNDMEVGQMGVIANVASATLFIDTETNMAFLNDHRAS